MGDIAICVEGLGKQYHIGGKQESFKTLRDTLADAFISPVRRASKLLLRGQAAAASELNGTIWALKDVSFEVKKGEVVGIIGRNGAGKSTLLKILSQITEPTTGFADIYGRVGSLLEVGTGFHPELTGRENIYLNGAILGMKRTEIERKFDEIVAFAEVEKFIDTPVKHYSSGMYLRLAFAVAAHLEPEILIVDEVLTVGDVAFQKKCLGKMRDVAKEGRTVLFVSHNMGAVQSLCTRAINLQAGQVVEDAPVEQVIAAYLNSVQQKIDGLSLADRADREGGDQLRIVGVEFLDAQTGVRLHTLLSGQGVLIRMHFECRAQKPIENLVFALSFFAIDGAHLFSCNSDAVGRYYRIGPGVGTCICRIGKWPLRAGRYTFNVFVNKGSVILDWVKDAGYVDVEMGDYYGSGVPPRGSKSGVFIDHDWEPTLTYLP